MYECGYGSPQVNQQIRRSDLFADGSEKTDVVFKIPSTHQAHFVQVRGKDVCVFIDSSVLNDNSFAFLDVDDLLETVIEEIYLQVKRPTGHILIEVVEIGVVFYILIPGFPVIMASQQISEGGFPGADISCYRYMLDIMLIVDGRKF